MAGSPTGFFKDSHGKVHPVFQSAGGVRHPMEKGDWLKSIGPEEKSSINMWTSDSTPFKQAAVGSYGDDKLTDDWRSALDTFNKVVDRAPTYNGNIYRGLHSLSESSFNGIVNAKTLSTKAPTSFSGSSGSMDYFSEPHYVTKNSHSVVFIAAKGKHNGGHIRPAQPRTDENEVVVPQGSVYHVDKVKVLGPNERGGKLARVYISHLPNVVEPKAVKLAGPTGFFRDEHGKVHPIKADSPKGRTPHGIDMSSAKKLEDAGFECYLVGGSVRDTLLGRKPHDLDFTTNATPDQILKVFPKGIYTNKFGTVIVPQPEGAVEITTYRGEGAYSDHRHPDSVEFVGSLKEDLSRRDFTVNAMAMDSKGEIIDPFGGKADIEKKQIRAVGNPLDRFSEDPLRMLRAVRQSSQLGFSIDGKTAEGITTASPGLKLVSRERVRDELMKMLTSNPSAAVDGLQKTGLMEHVLPSVKGNAAPETLKNYNGTNPLVRLGALLVHSSPNETNDDLKGLKLSRPDETFVRNLTDNARNLPTGSSESDARRFVSNAQANPLDVLDLKEAVSPKSVSEFRPKVQKVLDEKHPTAISDLAVNGDDLVKEMDWKPGPKVGRTLRSLLDTVIEDPKQNTKDKLLSLVKTGKVSMAAFEYPVLEFAGSPSGFFRDSHGKVHPLFTSEGGVRQPSANADEWKAGLKQNQRQAVSRWSLAVPNKEMKNEAAGKSHKNPNDPGHEYLVDTNAGNVPWGKRLNDFNEAVHTAPIADGTIYRGLKNLSKGQFDKLSKASTFSALTPVSFTTDAKSNFIASDDIYGPSPISANDVTIVSSKHNAGDISSLSEYAHEKEAVVPQGSRYQVVNRTIIKRPHGGHFAKLEVELAPAGQFDKLSKDVAMASVVNCRSKESVDFESPARGMDHCIQCENFESPNSCLRVTGKVHPDDWCKLFEINKTQFAGPRYFTDSHGKVHPISTDREPSATADEWNGNLTDRQKKSLTDWTHNSTLIKSVMNGEWKPSDSIQSEYEDKGHAFEEALHTAPSFSGPITRGITRLTDEQFDSLLHAKTLKTNSPVSFDASDVIKNQDIHNRFLGSGGNSVVFVADKHNGGDISSKSVMTDMGEHELVVPTGSTYKVTKAEETPKRPQGNRFATLHISYEPKSDEKNTVRLASSGSPTGFFKDAHGNVHPIFEGGEVRHPKGDSISWKNSLTTSERMGVAHWATANLTARHRFTDAKGNELEKQWLDGFNHAVDKAPAYSGPIYRGIRGLSDKKFHQALESKDFRTASHASFSKSKDVAESFAGRGKNSPRHSILFVAEKHNGADIEGGWGEHEVVVPKGSNYKVEKVVRGKTNSLGGKHATVYISHSPVDETKFSGSPTGFFRDEHGQVHPIGGHTIGEQTPNGPRLTEFDDDDIVKARSMAKSLTPTWMIQTPERDAFRHKTVQDAYGTGAKNKNREAWLVIGPPGAGKSSLAGPEVVEKSGSLLVDPDEFKKKIPEYNGSNSFQVHEESSQLAHAMLKHAVEKGDNIVYSGTGKSWGSIRDLRDALSEHGYKSHLSLVDLPTEKAMGRAVERFHTSEDHRFTDPLFVKEVDGRPKNTYEALKKEGGFVDYEAYSSDVPRGEKPRLLERFSPTRGDAPAGERDLGVAGRPRRGTGNPLRQSGQTPALAFGSPDGFFRDKQGKVHPISHDEWKSGLSEGETNSLKDWFSSSSAGHAIKQAERGKNLTSKTLPLMRGFQSAVARAPAAQGSQYRGISNLTDDQFKDITKAKYLRSGNSLSFSPKPDIAEFFADRLPSKHGNNVVFEATDHNAKDISSAAELHQEEHESVIPAESRYRVDSVDIKPLMSKEDRKKYGNLQTGKIAHIKISYEPKAHWGEVAFGSPTGFFKDAHGQTHPIFEPSGQRHPMDAKSWEKSLTDEQKQAIHDWSLGSSNKWFKTTAAKRPDESLQNGSYGAVDALHRAIDTAPVPHDGMDYQSDGKGFIVPVNTGSTIYRGMHDLSDKAFDKIVNSKTLIATSPVSFSIDATMPRKWFGSNRNPTKNSIVFRSTDHNAADIHTMAAERYRHEGEAVVPQGSRYKVDKVDVTPAQYPESGPEKNRRYKGAHAEITISLERSGEHEDKPVSLAAKIT